MKKSTRPIKFSAAGVLSADFNHIALFAEALGLNVKLITAYESSSEQDLAVIRGDVDGTLGSYTSKQKFFKSGDMIPILQFAAKRHKEMPTVLLGTELPNLTPTGKSLLTFINHQATFDRVFAASPGIPPARLRFLKTAVMKALNDPELQAIGEQQKRPLDPADATAVSQSVKQDLQMPATLKELINKTLKGYKG
jgi:tripartite-type tricarboxylate transporter receptor subunit TctC